MADSAQTREQKGRILDRLAELAGEGGQRPKLAGAATQMHRLVDFYDPPRGYIGRLQTIRAISDLAVGDSRFTSICRPLAAWRAYIDAVLPAAEKFADELGLNEPERSIFLAATDGDPLKRKGLKRHGLEGLLWPAFSSADEDKYLTHLVLQGQMLIAQVSILTVEFAVARATSAGVPDEGVYKYIYGPCLRARDFSKDEWSEALARLPGGSFPGPSASNPIDPKQYRKALDELIEESRQGNGQTFCGVSKETFRETLGSISAFIGLGIAGRKYRKRNHDGNGQNNRSPVTVTARAVGAGGDSGTASPVAEIVTRTRGTKEDRDALDRAGECPEDHLPRRHFILTAGGPRVAEHVRAAYDRANQFLPNRYTEQHPNDYDRVMVALFNDRRRLARKDQLELMAWIDTIFWLGCSPAQATSLMVGFPETPIPAKFDFFFRVDDRDAPETDFVPRICVRAIEPPYRSEYIAIAGERIRESWFEIADFGDLSRTIADLLDYLQAKGERPDLLKIREQAVRIFSDSEETYRKRLSGFVESVGLKFPVDPSEFGKILFQRANEVGDIVSADLLTCKDHHLAEVRRWYFTPTIEHLRTVHERAMASMFAEVPLSGWESRLSTSRLPKDERYVGSRRCIDVEFLKSSVGTLQEIVREVVAVRTDEDRRKRFALKHNALTVLAVWAVDICLGMRSTTHLYLYRSQYDGDTGFGTILEKGKARAFQLGASGRAIAAKYDAYIDSLVPYGLPQSSRAMPCYFLEEGDQSLHPVPVTPGSMSRFLSRLFRFDANWARRLVKTSALEQGLPAIYTDSYCGHAHRGEERYHPYGSFDPAPYFQTMIECTESLMDRITLTPDLFDPGFVEPCS